MRWNAHVKALIIALALYDRSWIEVEYECGKESFRSNFTNTLQ